MPSPTCPGTCTATGTVRATSMHVFAHTYANNVRCTHTTHTHTHTHTHTCVHSAAAGCQRACACTGASSPPTHRADTPTDQGHSTRTLLCCTACTSASVPACPAKNFAPLGPRAAFLSVRLSVCPHTNALTDLSNLLARPLQSLLCCKFSLPSVLLLLSCKFSLQYFMHCNLHCKCKFSLQYLACTAICTAIAKLHCNTSHALQFALQLQIFTAILCMHCNLHCNCIR
jgi:hypothetical protein